VPYGNDVSAEMVNRAAEQLWICHDTDLDKAEHLKEAASLVQNAFALWFLGFRFDPDNMARLGAPPGYRGQHVFYTTFKEEDHERERMSNALVGEALYAGSNDWMTLKYLRWSWDHFTRKIRLDWGQRASAR